MSIEQAKFEMELDRFEDWLAWNQRERDVD
jgi:hypothetical protein